MPTPLDGPTCPVLSIPDREFHLILPLQFARTVTESKNFGFSEWQPEVEPHQPNPFENLIIYNNRITIIKNRILVLNLIYNTGRTDAEDINGINIETTT